MTQVPPRAGRVIGEKGLGQITVTAKVSVVMVKATVMLKGTMMRGVTLRKVEMATTVAPIYVPGLPTSCCPEHPTHTDRCDPKPPQHRGPPSRRTRN